MRVLYAAAEASPLVKIGGLGDVAGSLPKALATLGLDVTVLIPDYRVIDHKKWQIKPIGQIKVRVASGDELVTVSQTVLPDSQVSVILLGNERYIAKGGRQAFENSATETDRFGFFSKAIVELLRSADFLSIIGQFDVIHANDWHTSLLPVFAIATLPYRPAFVLTIHNVAYQGINDYAMCDRLQLSLAQQQALVFDRDIKDINFLKQGILRVDLLNTVSKHYARELLLPAFAEGLEAQFQVRKDRLRGILNGIDYNVWQPETDQFVAKQFSRNMTIEQLQRIKQANKDQLLTQLGLKDETVPLFGFIGRLEPHQKGIDLIYDWLSQRNGHLDLRQVCVAILGKGDQEWEQKFSSLSKLHPQNLAVKIAFSEPLAHAMYAGCDYILMPSRFEPGGLPQMIAQHYGTVPLVHATGGLVDTVKEGKTGYLFQDYTPQAMVAKINQAIASYMTPDYWQMAFAGTKVDYSWQSSAQKYQEFYNDAIKYHQTPQL